MMSLIFCCFERFLAYNVFLPSFIVVRHQMAALTWGLSPPSNKGVDRTPSKIGLINAFKQVGEDKLSYVFILTWALASCLTSSIQDANSNYSWLLN